MACISDFDVEILRLIFEQANLKSILVIQLVCKRWKYVSDPVLAPTCMRELEAAEAEHMEFLRDCKWGLVDDLITCERLTMGLYNSKIHRKETDPKSQYLSQCRVICTQKLLLNERVNVWHEEIRDNYTDLRLNKPFRDPAAMHYVSEYDYMLEDEESEPLPVKYM